MFKKIIENVLENTVRYGLIINYFLLSINYFIFGYKEIYQYLIPLTGIFLFGILSIRDAITQYIRLHNLHNLIFSLVDKLGKVTIDINKNNLSENNKEAK